MTSAASPATLKMVLFLYGGQGPMRIYGSPNSAYLYACCIASCFLPFHTIYRVKLVMYLKNDVVETVPLDRSLISIPGYLGKIKRDLKEKYLLLLQESSGSVEFLVMDASAAPDAGLL